MELFNTIQSYLNNLDQKRFYQYIGAGLGIIALLMFLLIFQYYRKVRSLKQMVINTNELREEAQQIIGKGQQIKKDKKEIDAMLAQDPNFKIAGYFQDLTSKLGLANSLLPPSISTALREGQYQETILQAKFNGLTMKQLTELLQEVELNKRVFIKELEISSSKKQANSIDAVLTIATLEPKPKEVGESAG